MDRAGDIPNLHVYLESLRRNLVSVARPPVPMAGAERKSAAVMIPLFERGGELRVLYTRRSDDLESHRGQVAFPGGRYDRRDPHLLAAALRETHEEVGIPPENIEVLGSFNGRLTHTADIFVTPFVGVVHGTMELRRDPREVAEIFDVPLEVLRDRRYRGSYRFMRNGHEEMRPAILYNGQVIWGLTFDFTMRFLALVAGDGE